MNVTPFSIFGECGSGWHIRPCEQPMNCCNFDSCPRLFYGRQCHFSLQGFQSPRPKRLDMRASKRRANSRGKRLAPAPGCETPLEQPVIRIQRFIGSASIGKKAPSACAKGLHLRIKKFGPKRECHRPCRQNRWPAVAPVPGALRVQEPRRGAQPQQISVVR